MVQLLQLGRLRPAGEVHRAHELRLSDRQRDVFARARQQRDHHRRLASHSAPAGACRGDDGRRANRRGGVVPHDLLSALCAGRRRSGAHLALHVRRRLRPRRNDQRRPRPPTVLPARRQGLGVHRDLDRYHLEILRLLHDAVRRRTARHRQVVARSCRGGRREFVPAFPLHHRAAARADDTPVDLFRRRRLVAALRHRRAADRRGAVRHHAHDGVVPLLFRHHAYARRLRLGGGGGAVLHLRHLRHRLPTDLHAR